MFDVTHPLELNRRPPRRRLVLPTALLAMACVLIASPPLPADTAAAPAITASPTSVPSTLPSADQGAPANSASAAHRATVAKWFAELADDKSDVRESARQNLLKLDPDELPILRGVVADSVPLQPSQFAPLRAIVIHIFLRGQTYQTMRAGFLGVHFEDLPTDGARVAYCWPGSCGYAALEEGDIVLAVDRPAPGVEAHARYAGDDDDQAHVEIHSAMQILQLMSRTAPGDQIVLTLQRRGRILHVPIKLDARPVDPRDSTLELLGQERMEAGDNYWNDNFAPLLRNGVD